MEEAQSPISNGMWKLIQFSIFVGFLCANIFFGWDIDGLAAGVMGGMLAWYSTGIANHFLTKRYARGDANSSQ